MARRRISLLLVFAAGVALGAILASTATLHFLSDVRHSSAPSEGGCVCPNQLSLSYGRTTPTHSTTSQPTGPVTTAQAELRSTAKSFGQERPPAPEEAGSLKRSSLLVAVMTSERTLRRASSVQVTWASEAHEVIFFVGENCCTSGAQTHDLPLIKLNGVREESNLAFEKTSAALKYLTKNHPGRFSWILVVSDDTYVNLRQLDEFLAPFNPQQPSFVGYGGNARKYAEHCGGVALSVAAVDLLVPSLDRCGSSVVGSHQEVLERCISENVGINCTQLCSGCVKPPNAPSSSPLLPADLLSDPAYRNALAVCHVTEPEDMNLLHWYYKREEHHHLRERMEAVVDQIDTLCPSLMIEDCTPTAAPCPLRGDLAPPAPGDLPSPPPNSPHTIEDMVSWDFFDKGAWYNDRSIHPSHAFRVMESRKYEMKSLNAEATKEASRRYGKPLRFRKIIGGYTRYSPLVGVEYVMDAVFLDRSSVGAGPVHLRVGLVRPFAPGYVARDESSDTTTVVNFIVPVSNVDSRFAGFLEMYENIAIKNQEAVRLIVVTYGEEGGAFVNQAMQPYVERNANFKSTVVKGLGTFTRAQSIHLGMDQLEDSELAFVCDVDMEIKNHFFNRCRRNPVRGKRVFFPEFFKMYNLDFVNRHKDGAPPRDTIIRSYGHWASYSYGMVCIYKSDYVAVGGMNRDIVGWGEEDVDFYQRVLGKSLEVVRAPDTGLFHRWHEKECPTTLPATQYQHCLSSRAENLADRMELANYIFELQQNRSSA